MPSPVLRVRRHRDLTILDTSDGTSWVIACDSVGGIGPKPGDAYPIDARTVAHFATRVPLVEVLAAGATPEVIVDTLSVELEPTGGPMISEVRALAAELGLGPDRVTGSTEDNVPTSATGIGVTVFATAPTAHMAAPRARAGHRVLCLGRPTSAPSDRISIGDRRMIPLASVVAVRSLQGVGDLLPVGSKGVGHEAAVLANSNSLTWRTHASGFDFDHSGGPASCVLAAVAPEAVDDVLALLPEDLPHIEVGFLE